MCGAAATAATCVFVCTRVLCTGVIGFRGPAHAARCLCALFSSISQPAFFGSITCLLWACIHARYQSRAFGGDCTPAAQVWPLSPCQCVRAVQCRVSSSMAVNDSAGPHLPRRAWVGGSVRGRGERAVKHAVQQLSNAALACVCKAPAARSFPSADTTAVASGCLLCMQHVSCSMCMWAASGPAIGLAAHTPHNICLGEARSAPASSVYTAARTHVMSVCWHPGLCSASAGLASVIIK